MLHPGLDVGDAQQPVVGKARGKMVTGEADLDGRAIEQPFLGIGLSLHSNALLISTIISATSSRPTDSRKSPSEMPCAARSSGV